MSSDRSGHGDDQMPRSPHVVFADDWVVVVDKPSGMPSVPARTPLDPPAVAVRLWKTFGPLEAVHRLDRDTSGLLILARSREARAALGTAFEMRRVGKRYLAVVAGQPPDTSGTVSLPLAPDRERRPRHKVDHELGRHATTDWRLIATRQHAAHRRADGAGQIPQGDVSEPVSLMALEPRTGRSHQLRIHLAALGCPILGDRLYGKPPWNTFCPLALHAACLALDHPTTGARMTLTVPPPDIPPWLDFATAVTTELAAWPND